MILTPGQTTLAQLEALWRGAGVARLDPAAMPGVEAAAARVAAAAAGEDAVYGVNTGFGKLASVKIAAKDTATLQRNLILSHCCGVGEALDAATTRVLKLLSLGRGASGVRWAVIAQIEAMLAAGVVPVVPAQGSVGASGDLAPLAHMTAAMIGAGEATWQGRRMPGAEALAAAGLTPLVLGAKEGLGLINGTQFSTALALTGLFRAWRNAASSLVTAAMSTDAIMGSTAPLHPEIHSLRGHRGQIEVAGRMRALMDGSVIRESHVQGDTRVQDPYCIRCVPQVVGAAIDLLRFAAATLETEANAVTDNPLVVAGGIISGGNFHAEPVAFAADISANQEDHVSMAAHGARRLGPMNANLSTILGVEALCAAQGIGYRAPLVTSAPLRVAIACLRAVSPVLTADRYLAPDIVAAGELICNGDLIAAAGLTDFTL